MKTRLPKPANWQDFEDLCFVLWMFIWRDRHAQKNGRQGQPQSGVDVYGVPEGAPKHEGVQCKGKDVYSNQTLSIGEIKKETVKAKSFKPAIDHLVFATTSDSDSSLLEEVREYEKSAPFKISVRSWDEIDSTIRLYPQVKGAFYSDTVTKVQWRRIDASAFCADVLLKTVNETVLELMTNDMAKAQISPHLIYSLKNIAIEIGKNGIPVGATNSEVRFGRDFFSVTENGPPFDIPKALSNPKITKGGGLHQIEDFLTEMGSKVTFASRPVAGGNVHFFQFSFPIANYERAGAYYVFDIQELFFRKKAGSVVVPQGAKKLLIEYTQENFILSDAYTLARGILRQMDADAQLTIRFSAGCSPYNAVRHRAVFSDEILAGRLKIDSLN